MEKDEKSVLAGADKFQLPLCVGANVSDWLSEMELVMADDAEDVLRKYTNIGGQNGLELFI